MEIEKIDAINSIKGVQPLDLYTVQKVLQSSQLTDSQKVQFMKNHRTEIDQIVEHKISSADYKEMMSKRPLIKFRPLVNSYTKAGDKRLLAKSLNIPTSDVDNYIKNITLQIKSGEEIKDLSKDDFEKAKAYVYRHGTKDQLVNFLDYELSDAKHILKLLYSSLEYHTGGVADYFIRPIHRLDNNTMLGIYKVIDKNLKKSASAGQIDDVQSREAAQWALLKIYQIQNNSKLINAVKLYRKLPH